MQATFASLLTSRRFAPLFATQFLGAFNDNLLKSALAVLVTYRLAPDAGYEPASLVMVAGALFIAPFFLLSGVTGLLWESVPLLLFTLFLLGTHSTVFGPIKYSLLPQHLASSELVAGNSLIEAGTFLAILLGTIVGSSAVSFAQGPLFVGVLCKRQSDPTRVKTLSPCAIAVNRKRLRPAAELKHCNKTIYNLRPSRGRG